MLCVYLYGYRAGEPLDVEGGRVTSWAEWVGYDCTNSGALNEGGCPYLDDDDVECPLKENQIQAIQDWAVLHLALQRRGKYTIVQKLMVEEG